MRTVVCFKSLVVLNSKKTELIREKLGQVNKTSVQIAGHNFTRGEVLITDVDVSTYKDDRHFVTVTINCCTTSNWLIPILDSRGGKKFLGIFESTNMGFLTNSDLTFIGVL